MSSGQSSPKQKSENRKLLPLSVAALGIVYGDIGTSPLYAFRESFLAGPPLQVSHAHVLGVLSMIVWSLIIVITIKYLQVVMRADNHGEGGLIALVSLFDPKTAKSGSRRWWLVVIGLFGAALLFGDGTITPAISVLSALEGLEIATPALQPYVVPLTILILIVLFAFQYKGTAAIGRLFGPIMIIWFLTLGILGVVNIIEQPGVLRAINPAWAVMFALDGPGIAFLVLGAVFLAVTGGEALYADMGHFGTRPIRLAWFAIVLPGVVLNYFGQGALVLTNTQEISHPFYHLAPDWALYPLVGLSTVATIIASQAVISGVFSLTRQAINLGQLPPVNVIQTSDEEFGQIYIPSINWILLCATVGLVLFFQSSSNLASAYGVAISMDMLITTILILSLASHWRWHPVLIILLAIVFLPLDVAFLASNLTKIPTGGWYPMVVGLLVFGLMVVWRQGRIAQAAKLSTKRPSFANLTELLATPGIVRSSGTAVFVLRYDDKHLPSALFHMVTQLKSVSRSIILLAVEVEQIPKVSSRNRLEIEKIAPDVHYIKARYGFKESIRLPIALRSAARHEIETDFDELTYVLSTDVVLPDKEDGGLRSFPDRLFRFMNRNANRHSTHMGLPADKTVEIGVHLHV